MRFKPTNGRVRLSDEEAWQLARIGESLSGMPAQEYLKRMIAESNLYADAVSNKDAIGVFQIEADTAERWGYTPEEMYDPRKAVIVSALTDTWHWNQDQVGKSPKLLHRAYNNGLDADLSQREWLREMDGKKESRDYYGNIQRAGKSEDFTRILDKFDTERTARDNTFDADTPLRDGPLRWRSGREASFFPGTPFETRGLSEQYVDQQILFWRQNRPADQTTRQAKAGSRGFFETSRTNDEDFDLRTFGEAASVGFGQRETPTVASTRARTQGIERIEPPDLELGQSAQASAGETQLSAVEQALAQTQGIQRMPVGPNSPDPFDSDDPSGLFAGPSTSSGGGGQAGGVGLDVTSQIVPTSQSESFADFNQAVDGEQIRRIAALSGATVAPNPPSTDVTSQIVPASQTESFADFNQAVDGEQIRRIAALSGASVAQRPRSTDVTDQIVQPPETFTDFNQAIDEEQLRRIAGITESGIEAAQPPQPRSIDVTDQIVPASDAARVANTATPSIGINGGATNAPGTLGDAANAPQIAIGRDVGPVPRQPATQPATQPARNRAVTGTAQSGLSNDELYNQFIQQINALTGAIPSSARTGGPASYPLPSPESRYYNLPRTIGVPVPATVVAENERRNATTDPVSAPTPPVLGSVDVGKEGIERFFSGEQPAILGEVLPRGEPIARQQRRRRRRRRQDGLTNNAATNFVRSQLSTSRESDLRSNIDTYTEIWNRANRSATASITMAAAAQGRPPEELQDLIREAKPYAMLQAVSNQVSLMDMIEDLWDLTPAGGDSDAV